METETVLCALTHIRWRNTETNFTIGNFTSQDWGEFAALGNMFDASVGMTYNLRGEWVDDPKWGRQLRFNSYEAIYPKTADGIYRYIVRVARWVGPKIGRAITKKYGDESLEILRTDPERVAAEIKGITLPRALEIQEELQNNIAAERTIVELENMLGGMGNKYLPSRAFEKWKVNAPEIIRENPYVLTEIRGIGFQTADMIAINRLGVARDSIFRQISFIEHEIRKNAMEKGDIWIEQSDLLNRGLNILGLSPVNGLDKMINGKDCVKDENLITLSEFHSDELMITLKIEELTIGESEDDEWI